MQCHVCLEECLTLNPCDILFEEEVEYNFIRPWMRMCAQCVVVAINRHQSRLHPQQPFFYPFHQPVHIQPFQPPFGPGELIDEWTIFFLKKL